jgi:hypothetical protein
MLVPDMTGRDVPPEEYAGLFDYSDDEDAPAGRGTTGLDKAGEPFWEQGGGARAGRDRTPPTTSQLSSEGRPQAPTYCEIHEHHKWCQHNGGVMGPGGWESPSGRSRTPSLNDVLHGTEREIVGCDLCQAMPESKWCPSNGGWKRSNLPLDEQVLRFWLAHGINPDAAGAHGHHAAALVALLTDDASDGTPANRPSSASDQGER